MDKEQLRTIVLETLTRIAPEVETEELDPIIKLREQVDLDSVDWLNFLVGLHERLHVDIPESDYAQLVSVDTLVNYLAAKQKHEK